MADRRIPYLGWFLLAVGVALSLFLFLGWHIYESHRFFGHIGTEFVRQTETLADVRALRWELTQAAHHVVLFGENEERRKVYADAARRLDTELDTGLGLPQDSPESISFSALGELARKLGAIERQAMDAAGENRQTEALSLLHSPEYMEDTRVLCAKADAHAKSVYARLQQRLRSHGKSELVFFSVDIAVFVFAGGLWWLLGMRLQRWRQLAEVEVSRRMNAEEQLLQSQKMEALGQMAAGVGHDFKNVLSTILGYADLASRAAEQGRVDQASLKGIQAAAQQGTAVTRALLTFSHNTGPTMEPVDLCRLLAETTELLQQTLPASIEIATRSDVPANECRIMGDRNQLQQVLLNLALNAGDAMPSGGTLTIAVTVGEGKGADMADGAVRPDICLSVSDTGKGIAPEIRDRIFEPFFTTKSRGQSTGLGLAIVHAIAVDHGADITVSSVPGKGTTFRLCFPSDDGAPERLSTVVTDEERLLLIASPDAYQAQLLASAIDPIGLPTERVGDWHELREALGRHRRKALTLLLDGDFPGCSARTCREVAAETGVHPRILVLADRDAPCIREYEDAGFMVLQRPLALAELVRLVAKGRAQR